MQLSALAGNAKLKEQLSRQMEGRGLSHAYVISGPVGSGRHTLARLLCAAMLCTAPCEARPCGKCIPCKKALGGIHPDVSLITGAGEGKSITVNQIRALRTDAYIRPNEGERKIYLLEGAERMNASAQNAMLKLLEDGPSYAAFLLLAENGAGLLETVRSRCEELSLTPVPLGECCSWLKARFPGKRPEEIEQAALNCQGLLGRAVELLAEEEQSQTRRALVQRLCRLMESGSELELLEASMALEALPKGELPLLLDELEGELVTALARSSQPRRLNRGVELVRRLRGAQRLNVSPGQLSGWLCAGLFFQKP